MKGELRYLADSNQFVVDYYDNIMDSHGERIASARSDIENILRYSQSLTAEVYVYAGEVDMGKIFSDDELYRMEESGEFAEREAEFNFYNVSLETIQAFDKLVANLTSGYEDFTIDNIRFELDEKEMMGFKLSETIDKVIEDM